MGIIAVVRKLSAAASCLAFCACAFGTSLRVADFGAVPDGKTCSLKAFSEAVKYARKNGVKEILLDAGTYVFKVGNLEKKTCISIRDIDGLSLIGQTDKNGNPATVLLREYDFSDNASAKPILWVHSSKNFTLKNVVFDNFPRYSSAAEVVEVDESGVSLKVLEGNPLLAGTHFYCANLWDPNTRMLKHVESLTYGGDAKTAEFEVKILDAKKGLARLDSPKIAQRVKVGDLVSWCFGYNGMQVSFEKCDNLYVENVHTLNAVGFCMNTSESENVRSKGVKFTAPDNQLMVCSRDAWKSYANTGEVVMEDMFIEGVRWDGQNAHGTFLKVAEISGEYGMVLLKYKGGWPSELKASSKIGFMVQPSKEIVLTVESVEMFRDSKRRPNYIVKFREKIPPEIDKGVICNVYAWTFGSYRVSNCTFKNIAGSPGILRNANAIYEGCRFINVMYPLLVGGALNEGEGIVPRDVEIRNCEFVSSGWIFRQGAYGCVALRSSKPQEKYDYDKNYRKLSGEPYFYMRNIKITGNTFKDSKIGISSEGVDRLEITGNTFINVETPVLQSGNKNVLISGNAIRQEARGEASTAAPYAP